jgi:charged multivesicular body protein 7
MTSAPTTPSKARSAFIDIDVLPTFAETSRARLQALYADFGRQKQSSPSAFRANVEWWARTLRALVGAGLQPGCAHALVLRATPALPDVFRYEGVGKPLALGAVIVRRAR